MSVHSAIWAAAIVIGLSTQVSAQSMETAIPSPTNPYPVNPVATDGSSLAGVLGPSGNAMDQRAYVAQAPNSTRESRSRHEFEVRRMLEDIDQP